MPSLVASPFRRFAGVVLVAVGSLLTVAAESARAHFLFLRLGEHAEAGRSVDVFFSEYATTGDPKFVEKIAGTKLWTQTEPGKFQSVEVRRLPDRLRAMVPSSSPLSVIGRCDYGVLTRKVPFLLRHYPKGVSGDPTRLAALTPNKDIPLEIMAGEKEGAVVFTVIQKGKPVAGAKLTTVDDDLTNEELETNEAGQATWTPKSPGYYCVYTGVTLPQAGEHDGKAYTEIREFATVSFRWPLVPKADEKAVELFEKALAARAAWHDFPGFSAEVKGSVDGTTFAGSAQVKPDGHVDLTGVSSAPAAAWIEDQLGSMVLHRKASPPSTDRPVLYFADDDTQHPLGRLLTFAGGRFASSYRAKDDQLFVVNRSFGPQNMTITVDENSTNPEGKYLPHAYTVHYWNAADGKLQKVESAQNRWTRIGKLDLPTRIAVTTASETGLSVRTLDLSGHALLKAEPTK
jgi:hypothetical protein